MTRPRVHLRAMLRAPASGVWDRAWFSLTPCADCAAPCCASLRCRLTLREALRVATTLHLPLADVVVPVPEDHPWFTLPLPLETGPVTLAFRAAPDGACAFLHRIQGRGRCSIHAVRPGVCRLYPYTAEFRGRRYAVGDQRLCPRTWLFDAPAEKRVAADLERWLMDLEAERRLLRGWARTRGPRTLESAARYVLEREPVPAAENLVSR